ncbi:MAG: ilvJ [Marmoricola sp.]|jgi:branched-chain amino acid transport system substrate-binding protein|nr:ilvJ [Marmoricola sp.]
MPRKQALICLVAVTAVALAGCSSKKAGSSSEDGVTSTTIHLGAVSPQSGASASFGDVTTGIKAYFDYTNAAGGINGRKIDFTVLDDAYDPSKTVPQTEKLVTQDKVFAITGNVGTKTSQAVYQRLNTEKVPSIMASGDPTMVSPILPYIFEGLAPLDADINEQIAYVKATYPGKKVGFLAENNDSATNELSLLTPAFGSLLVKQSTFLLTDPDLSSQIVALKNAGAQVIIFNGVPKYLALAVSEARGQNWQVPFISNNASVDSSFLSTAGAQADGVVTVTGFKTDPADPEVVKANDILKQYAPSITPGPLSQEGLAVGQIVVAALKAAGKDLTRSSFLSALNATNISSGVFIGQATMSPTKHNPYGCEQALQVKSGVLAPIGDVTCGS